jgi:hypothetical protein
MKHSAQVTAAINDHTVAGSKQQLRDAGLHGRRTLNDLVCQWINPHKIWSGVHTIMKSP